MKRILAGMFLALLYLCGARAAADEALERELDNVLRGIPGRSAFWVESFRPGSSATCFSPVIIRTEDWEEYRLVLSILSMAGGGYVFAVVPPDDPSPLEIVTASGANVTYQLNLPARLPPEDVLDRIRSADKLASEYRFLDGRGWCITILCAGLTVLCGLGLNQVTTDPSLSSSERLEAEVLLGACTAVGGLAFVSSFFLNLEAEHRRPQILRSLRSTWQ